MKIILNIPGNMISAPTFNSILKFQGWTQQFKDFTLIINNGSSSHVGFAREKLVGYGTGKLFPDEWMDYDYQFWVDSDIEFDHSHFEMLVDDNQDIMTGYYRMSDARNRCCVFPEGGTEFVSAEQIEQCTTLIPLDHGGFGFTLIKKGVFESIERPYFLDQTVQRDGKTIYVGEDIAFFHKAKEAGYKIYADPRCRVLHYKTFLI